MANVGLLPVEVAETEYSVSILRTELIPGSQGLGLHNGGLGIRRDYEVMGTPQVATIYGEQTKPDFYPLSARLPRRRRWVTDEDHGGRS
jgi:N-methylhydantoinase B